MPNPLSELLLLFLRVGGPRTDMRVIVVSLLHYLPLAVLVSHSIQTSSHHDLLQSFSKCNIHQKVLEFSSRSFMKA